MSRPTSHGSELSRHFWAGCDEGELRIQHCSSCDRAQFFARIACTNCGGKDLQWRVSSGKGKVASFTVVRQAVAERFAPLIPYAVALVDLEEGVRIMSVVHGADPAKVTVGAEVVVDFVSWDGDEPMPLFKLT